MVQDDVDIFEWYTTGSYRLRIIVQNTLCQNNTQKERKISKTATTFFSSISNLCILLKMIVILKRLKSSRHSFHEKFQKQIRTFQCIDVTLIRSGLYFK